MKERKRATPAAVTLARVTGRAVPRVLIGGP
jgi:hypothetical protein